MIQIGDLILDLSDPVILLALALGGLVFVLLFMSLMSARRAAKLSEPLVYQLAQVGQRVQSLSDGQERLSGGLHHVSEAQAQSQTAMLQLMERRLAQVQSQMNENLHGSARRTAQSLGRGVCPPVHRSCARIGAGRFGAWRKRHDHDVFLG